MSKGLFNLFKHGQNRLAHGRFVRVDTLPKSAILAVFLNLILICSCGVFSFLLFDTFYDAPEEPPGYEIIDGRTPFPTVDLEVANNVIVDFPTPVPPSPTLYPTYTPYPTSTLVPTIVPTAFIPPDVASFSSVPIEPSATISIPVISTLAPLPSPTSVPKYTYSQLKSGSFIPVVESDKPWAYYNSYCSSFGDSRIEVDLIGLDSASGLEIHLWNDYGYESFFPYTSSTTFFLSDDPSVFYIAPKYFGEEVSDVVAVTYPGDCQKLIIAFVESSPKTVESVEVISLD